MAEESLTIEQEQTAEPSEEQNGHGHGRGFVLGMVFGTLAGAAAATLFAPATGEEFRHRFSEEGGPFPKHEEDQAAAADPSPETPVERVRALLTRVRSRVQDAAAEGQQASLEAEEAGRTRYAELTHSEQPPVQRDDGP